MVGHSKWSQVKHIKRPLDAKRGAAFGKLVKEITVAVRIGGDDLSGNPRLRSVVETARTDNMPRENIGCAIHKNISVFRGAHDEEVLHKGPDAILAKLSA